MSRPEGSKPPDLFYDEVEARKYDSSSRMINIQREISNRAIEMLGLPAGKAAYILDVGCGSGLSGLALEEAGHYWVGCDISRSMLDVANQRENEKGDLIKNDMGQGLPFRPGTFDGVISISALQWLCYSDSNEQNPIHRLNKFFSSLYMILKKDARYILTMYLLQPCHICCVTGSMLIYALRAYYTRAVLQFYPETSEQAVIIAQAASKVGFAGGVVVDYPNSSKAKKYYLCLSFERTYKVNMRTVMIYCVTVRAARKRETTFSCHNNATTIRHPYLGFRIHVCLYAIFTHVRRCPMQSARRPQRVCR